MFRYYSTDSEGEAGFLWKFISPNAHQGNELFPTQMNCHKNNCQARINDKDPILICSKTNSVEVLFCLSRTYPKKQICLGEGAELKIEQFLVE